MLVRIVLLLLISTSCFGQAKEVGRYFYMNKKANIYKKANTGDSAYRTMSKDDSVFVLRTHDNELVYARLGDKQYYVRKADLTSEVPLSFYKLPVDELGRINISEVVEVPEVLKEELFLRAKTFMVDAFTSSKAATQLEEKEPGVIIAKGYYDLSAPVPSQVWFTIRLSVKDERYRYEVYDVSFKNYPTPYNPVPEAVPAEFYFSKAAMENKSEFGKTCKQFREQAIISLGGLFARVNQVMANNSSNNNDW